MHQYIGWLLMLRKKNKTFLIITHLSKRKREKKDRIKKYTNKTFYFYPFVNIYMIYQPSTIVLKNHRFPPTSKTLIKKNREPKWLKLTKTKINEGLQKASPFHCLMLGSKQQCQPS
ncbi:hypothetical protein V8G54_027261 [Vigna mungo]|uniref:Uncharacterized protein n=1 Tax=Vigna mungo TaxID=3915 RepID=A0AAQ3N273_VIGMU